MKLRGTPLYTEKSFKYQNLIQLRNLSIFSLYTDYNTDYQNGKVFIENMS